MLIGGLDQFVEQILPLDRVGDGGQFLAEPEPDGALEPHAADLPGRPGNSELRGVKRAAGHRHRTQPVALAQDDHPERHRQPRPDDEQPAEPPDGGVDFCIRADHEARRIAQRDDRQLSRFAERQEVGHLVRGLGVDGSAEMMAAVGNQPERHTFDSDERGDHADSVVGPQLQNGSDIGDRVDRVVHVVGP